MKLNYVLAGLFLIFFIHQYFYRVMWYWYSNPQLTQMQIAVDRWDSLVMALINLIVFLYLANNIKREKAYQAMKKRFDEQRERVKKELLKK